MVIAQDPHDVFVVIIKREVLNNHYNDKIDNVNRQELFKL